MTRARIACVALLAVAALALSGCGRDQPPVVGTTTIDVADRAAIPPIAGTTLDGSSIDLDDLRGKVVVLNSWATWCGPCRSEVPAFVALDANVDRAGIAIVGLNVSDDTAAANAFVKELAMTYPSIVDSDGRILPTIPGVPPSALPSTVIIDREGRIAVRIIGEVDPVELPRLVAAVVAEK